MNKVAKKNWAIAWGYVAFIYLTLEIMPIPAQILRQHGLLRATLYTTFALCVAALLRLLWRRGASAKRMAGLFFILLMYSIVAHFVATPEEKIHFIEYGFVGIFFARALSTQRIFSRAIFYEALAYSIAVGWVDEILQGLLPHRVYDIHDVILNAVSACLGLAILALVRLPKQTIKNDLN